MLNGHQQPMAGTTTALSVASVEAQQLAMKLDRLRLAAELGLMDRADAFRETARLRREALERNVH